MITRARPRAIRRSRVQARISARRECNVAERSAAVLESERSLPTFAVGCVAVTTEDDAGIGVSGEVEVAGCFSSGLSILGRLTFIARPSRPAPDANCLRCYRRAMGASGGSLTEILRAPL